MGQWTNGIMFGVIEPDGIYLHDDYEDNGRGPGLLDKWEKACARKIATLAKSGKLARFESARARFVPAVDRARLRWRRFARWARTQGVKLPRAQLFLARCEVA